MCMCSWPNECAGTGVMHCSPPCGGDQCICACGGEGRCPGCEYCEDAPDSQDQGHPDDESWLDDDASYDRSIE
jgi:hypothetical protein